jgi:hypothetical protein
MEAAQGGDHHGVGVGGAAVGDHVLDQLGFEAAGAGETPAGLHQFLDQADLVGVGGLVRAPRATLPSSP